MAFVDNADLRADPLAPANPEAATGQAFAEPQGASVVPPPPEPALAAPTAPANPQASPEGTVGASATDDLSGEFLRAADERRLDQLLAGSAAAAARAETRLPPAPEPEGGPPATGGGFTGGVKAVGRDMVRGVVETPMQMLGGVRDAAQNTIKALDDMAWWLAENVGDPLGGDPTNKMKLDLPEVPKAVSVTGGVVRAISQFVIGFVPAVRAVRAASGGAAVSGLGQAAQAVAAGGLASGLVFDPHESRLSNLIEEVPALKNPVTAYLKAKPEDTAAEGRLKNAIEGLAFGSAAEGVVLGVRAIRANRIAKGIEPKTPLAEPEPSVVKAFGDPKEPLVVARQADDASRETPARAGRPDRAEAQVAAQRYLNGDIPADQLPFRMNWSRFTDPEAVEQAVDTVARLFKGSFDEARRGTVTDDELRGLASSLGLTPEEMLTRQRGAAWNAERILAAKAIVESSATKLQELARVARTSTDDADLFAFRRFLDVHSGLQKQFQGAVSEAGRALRATQVPTGSIERQIAEISGMMARDGGPERIRSLANAIAEINDPSQINRVARNSLGRALSDSAVEAWYFALLSGPQTHAVNMLTSGLNTFWQIPERALAAQFSRLRGTQNSVEVGEATEMAYGMVGAFTDALRAAGRTLRSGEPSDIFGKVEARNQRAISAENFGLTGEDGSAGWMMGKAIDGFGAFMRSPTRALMAEDEFYRTIGKSMEMRAVALREVRQAGLEGEAAGTRMQELLTNPPQHMLDAAQDFSRSLTFTSPLKPGGFGDKLSQISQFAPVKAVLPFVRTPMNLLKYTFEHSPLAPLSTAIRQDIAKGGPAGDLALAKITMGSALSLTFADLALRGQVTGSGPADPEQRQAWLRTHQPNSIRIGDQWYSYNRLDPFGMLVGISADYAQLAGQIGEDDAGKLATAMAVATSKNVLNKTWMRGPADLVEAMHDPERFMERYLRHLAGTFLVPTGSAQVARTVDPVWRDVQSLMDEIKSRTPGFSQDLPPRRNLWGEPITMEGGLGPDIISPVYKSSVKNRPIDDYIVSNKIEVAMPPRTQQGVEMKPHEYSRFVELAGNALKDPVTGLGAYDTMNAIMAGKHPLSAQWYGATDGPEGGRADVLRGVIGAYRKAAAARFMEESPDFSDRVQQRREEKARARQDTIMAPTRGRLP